MTDYRGHHRPAEDGDVLSALGTGTFPSDVCQHPEWYGGEHAIEAASVARTVQGRPDAEVVIYRAVPPGVSMIGTGDWVAVTEGYARQCAIRSEDPADDWPVISATVRAGDVRNGGGDLEEWGYWGPSVQASEHVNIAG